MRIVFILICTCFLSNSASSQYFYNYRNSVLNYSFIKNEKLYLSKDTDTTKKKRDYIIVEYKLNDAQNNYAIFNPISFNNYFSHFSWDLISNKMISISDWGTIQDKRLEFDIINIETNHESSGNSDAEKIKREDSVPALIQPTKQAESYKVYPVKLLIEETLNGNLKNKDIKYNLDFISYNFIALDENQLELFYRDKHIFSFWKFKLKEDQKHSDFIEINTYCNDSIRKPFRHKQHLPSVQSIKSYSIKDSLFFTGHFKVIKQKENRYIINLYHGAIYYMSEKSIDKIGQIDLLNYEFQLKGDNLFIEDRDNNQIIFFAPVEWIRDDLPKPNVKIITDEEEFKGMFKYVLE